jgi:hypothetical protein
MVPETGNTPVPETVVPETVVPETVVPVPETVVPVPETVVLSAVPASGLEGAQSEALGLFAVGFGLFVEGGERGNVP